MNLTGGVLKQLNRIDFRLIKKNNKQKVLNGQQPMTNRLLTFRFEF